MKKFVWDTSAIINIKESDLRGYSPGHSLMKDLVDGIIPGPYQNIFPALAVFELNAAISWLHRAKKTMLREFYIFDESSIIYPIDEALIRKSVNMLDSEGFSSLKGADLVFACVAKVESAFLVTKDKAIASLQGKIDIIDLNESISAPRYRDVLLGGGKS